MTGVYFIISFYLSFLKNKSKSLEDIYNNSKYIFSYELNENQIQKIDKSKLNIIKDIYSLIKKDKNISKDYLKSIFDKIIETEKINFKDLGQPLRIILTGSEYGPAIYDIANSLGLDEFLKKKDSANDGYDLLYPKYKHFEAINDYIYCTFNIIFETIGS